MASVVGGLKLITRLSKPYRFCIYQNSSFSVEAAVAVDHKLPRFRTLENDPLCHTEEHIGKYYTIQKDVRDKLFLSGGITRALLMQMKTFNESCFMIRKPALELMTYLKNLDYSLPPVRFVLYGRNGVGKTCTLCHILHFASRSKYLLLHIPWVSNWLKTPKDAIASQFKPDRIDLPIESALWLQHFRSQNLELLKELNLLTTQSYSWSVREITEKGQPLMDIITHGIERIPHASDCVAVLLKEIKCHSASGRFKSLVVIDGVNCFYDTSPNLRRPDKTLVKVTPRDVTVVRAFEKMIKTDWTNAAIIVSVDSLIGNSSNTTKQNPYTPLALLGTEGFEIFDPFIPVLAEKYTNKEAESTLDYYVDRMWIQNEEARTEEGRAQLKFLSGNNPYELRILCDPL